MRTTITLDPDVESLVRAEMSARAISFKAALNDAVRIGLSGRNRAGKFVQKSFHMGKIREFRRRRSR